MDDDKLPGWAYPTREATKLHYFRAKGEPSLCRRYIASIPALMDPPTYPDDVTERQRCAVCWRKSPAQTICSEEAHRG